MTIFFDAADLNDIRITAETPAHFSARVNLLDDHRDFEKRVGVIEDRITHRATAFPDVAFQ